jgi:hypothetical protein
VLEDLTGHLGRATHEWQPEAENRTPARGQGRKITADRPDRDRRCTVRVDGNKVWARRFGLGHAEIEGKKTAARKWNMKKGSALRDPVEKKTRGGKDQNNLVGLNLASTQESAQSQMPRSRRKSNWRWDPKMKIKKIS